jgi:phenylacetic acid degradation operon negative regulatory protein
MIAPVSAKKRQDVVGFEVVRPQDLVFTVLGAYARTGPDQVWSGGLVRLLAELDVSNAAARVALARLFQRGLLERHRDGRLVFYRLTKHTEHVLEEGDRRILSLGSSDGDWDGRWTLLWHSIPGEERAARARLGRRLRFLGFGSIQDGAWISPRDREREVTALVEELELATHVDVMIGRPAVSLPVGRLVERAWDLDALTRGYRKFVAQFDRYRTAQARDELDDRGAFRVRTRLVHAFRGFPFLDPDLPIELMPGHPERARAAETFHLVYEALAKPAQRHFDSATSHAPS